MPHHKPFECLYCGAGCKMIQGLRDHERFRHGLNASPNRRFMMLEGQIVGTGESGMTFQEALDVLRFDVLTRRLDQIESKIRELMDVVRAKRR